MVCLSTLEKASFICWSTVFNRKYLSSKNRTQDIQRQARDIVTTARQLSLVIMSKLKLKPTTGLRTVPAAKYTKATGSVCPLLAHFLVILHLLCLMRLQVGSVCNHLKLMIFALPSAAVSHQSC